MSDRTLTDLKRYWNSSWNSSFIFYLRPWLDLLIKYIYTKYFFSTTSYKLLDLYSCLNIRYYLSNSYMISPSFFFKNITRSSIFRFEFYWKYIWNLFLTMFLLPRLSSSQRKFTSAPTVLVSAEHERRGVKHDASSVWVEDVTTTSFKICVRELQNFDGAHESIHMVSCFVYLLCAYF